MAQTKIEAGQLEFRLLDKACNCKSFFCGEKELDKWFRDKASRRHAQYLTRVTTVHLQGNSAPVGYYSLSLHSEPTSYLTKIQRQLSWDSGVFPAVQLTYLAVIRQMQDCGIGRLLLGHAMERTYQIAQMAGVFALILRPLPGKEGFYAKHGFVPYGHSNGMLLPTQSIVDAFEQNA